jgi:hypothetical protein
VDIDITLDPKKFEEVRSTLAGLPKKSRFVLNAAIKYALRRARTAALRIAGERYQLGGQYSKAYRWALQAMGPVRVIGTTGYVHVSGSRIPLMLFPNTESLGFVMGSGTEVFEMAKGEGFVQRHIFGKNLWHRTGKGAPRYPIFREVGLATSQMVGQRSEVKPKLEKSISIDLYTELDRLMRVALAGGFNQPSS